jgi:hypothetical protein
MVINERFTFYSLHCRYRSPIWRSREAGPAGTDFNDPETARVPAENGEGVMTKFPNQAAQQNSSLNDYVAGALMAAVLLLSGLLSLSQFAI